MSVPPKEHPHSKSPSNEVLLTPFADIKSTLVTRPDSETINAWFRAVLLPFWLDASWDRRYGGFVERLDRHGRVAPLGYKRVRLQGRQIYVFAQAAVDGLLPEAAEAAKSGVEFVIRNAWNREEGGWVFKLSIDGRQQLDEVRHLYCQAFVLFGFAWYMRCAKDPEVLGWIDKTLAFIDTRMTHPSGGYWNMWTSSAERTYLPRLQNPHMHLLEALLVLAETTRIDEYLNRARKLVWLLRNRLCPPPHQRVGEYFDELWGLQAGPDGSRHEPGHQFEWIWILHQYRQLSGDTSIEQIVEPLLEYTLKHGVDRADNALFAVYDEIDAEGMPLVASKRLWPQTEMLKALLAAYEWSGERKYRTAAVSTLKMILQTYLRGGEPLFDEHYDRFGHRIVDDVPVSSLYHLYLALSEAARVLTVPHA
jgi:mannose/cellobiose epimerase-like protein (N-acyl-D-glucosamine 2-epimerase family)